MNVWLLMAAYTVFAPGLLVQAELGNSLESMREPKCIMPVDLDHGDRSRIYEECMANHYGKGAQCYPELGCFPNEKPWRTFLRPFPPPLPPPEINTDFYCFTRESEQMYNLDVWPKISFNGCPFHAMRPTAFITHGFASSANFTWLLQMKDLYLDEIDANVFLIDWSRGARLHNYLQVASNIRIVGAELARFLRWLIQHHGLDTMTVHLIGHSLGAHASAYAAKEVGNIKRITAFDPAQPGFEARGKAIRLDKGDAAFVDILHTNSQPFIPFLGFGLIRPHGHVDFYLNGGITQPGCMSLMSELKELGEDIWEAKSLADLMNHSVEDLNEYMCCSHMRSYMYFTDALSKNCSMWGQKVSLITRIWNAGTEGLLKPILKSLEDCTADTCLPVGMDTPLFKARGTFSVETTKTKPYCSEISSKASIVLQNLSDEAHNRKPKSIKLGVKSKKLHSLAAIAWKKGERFNFHHKLNLKHASMIEKHMKNGNELEKKNMMKSHFINRVMSIRKRNKQD